MECCKSKANIKWVGMSLCKKPNRELDLHVEETIGCLLSRIAHPGAAGLPLLDTFG